MLWRWLKPKDASLLIGMDISSDIIKLVQVDAEHSPKKLIAYSTWPLPKNALIKGEVKDPNMVAEHLRKAIDNSNIVGKNIGISIPKSSVIIKNTTVDKRLTSQEIESRAWIEANKNFPDLVGEIYLDYQVLGTSVKNENLLELMMVACKKDLVNPYIKAFNAAGLKEKIVDVNSYVLERMIHEMEDVDGQLPITIGLLHLNHENSTLIVIDNNSLIYAHDQTFGGSQLIEKANKFITEKNGDNGSAPISMNDAAYANILQETLTMHLRTTMHFFYSSRSNVKMSKMLISGDCATLPDIAPFIQAELSVTAELANPFKHMEIASDIDVDALNKIAPSLVLCTGLAISEIEEGVAT